MRKRIMIEVELDSDDSMDGLLSRLGNIEGITNGRIKVLGTRALHREFGRSYRGMGGEILPTGPVTPSRGQDQHVRWVTSWESIPANLWTELGAERGKSSEA